MERKFRARKFAFYDAVVRDGDVTILELRLIWRLIDRLNFKTGDSWPSLKTIAAELGCNLRALKRAEKRLEQKGWFLVLRGGGRGRSNHYIPNWDKVLPKTSSDSGRQYESVACEVENSGSRVLPRVANQPPESINDPLYESNLTIDDSAVERRSNGAVAVGSTVIHAMTTKLSNIAPQNDEHHYLDFWERWIDWLHQMGRYGEEWGYGSRDLAAADIQKLRHARGDAWTIRRLESARDRGFYGQVLRRHVAITTNTPPDGFLQRDQRSE